MNSMCHQRLKRRGGLLGLASCLAVCAIVFTVPLRGLAQVTPGTPSGQTAIISGAVLNSDAKPIAGADVKLIGPSKGETTTDAEGLFTFAGVAFGQYSIIVVAKDYGSASRDHIAVSGDTSVTVKYLASASGMKTIAQISTTGAATINVTPASITQISPSAYAFQGQTSWHRLLEDIPGVAVGGNLESGDNPSTYVSASPFFPAVVSINGSEPYETATLLDGMPIYVNLGFSPVGYGTDLSVMPLNSFDSADVIRGPGADSPSIVNSVGGTFELHAPGQVLGNHFEFAGSDDPYGGYIGNAKVQLRLGRLSMQYVYGFNNSPGPEHGQEITSEGALDFASINGNSYYCPGGFFNECLAYLGDKYDFFGDGEEYYGGKPLEFDHYQESLIVCCQTVTSGWNSHNGSGALSYQIGSAITAQVFWAGSKNWASQVAPYWETTFAPGSLGTSGGGAYTGSVPAGTYDYITADYDNLAHSNASILEEKVTANFGQGGVVQVAALQGYSNYTQVLPQTAGGQYQLWGTVCYGTAGPTCPTPVTFNGTMATLEPYASGSYITEDWANNRDLLFSYSTQVGSSSNIGASYVTSYYNQPYVYGYTGAAYAYYNGSEVPSINNTTDETRLHFGTELSDKLSLDLSWYFALASYHVANPAVSDQSEAHPSSWANSTEPYNAPRLGAVWRASQDIAIRAAAGGGFAIAPLGDLVGTNGGISCSVGLCSEVVTNLNLQPEKSFGYDVGTDIRLHHNTVLSFDVYHTTLYGQIFEAAKAGGFFMGQPLIVDEYRNLNVSIMEGINLDVRHDVPRGIYWHAGIGLTRGYIPYGSLPASFYSIIGGHCSPTTLTECQNTEIVPGINFDGAYPPIARVPYSNGNAQIGYRWSPQKFIELSPTYYGPNNAYFVPAFAALDVHAGYPLTKNVTFYGNFQNVTGEHDELGPIITPSTVIGIPTIVGTYPWEGLPSAYAPRTFLLTINYSY